MELNIKKAFCAPFSDKNWYLKLIFPILTMVTVLILFEPMIAAAIPQILGLVVVIGLIPAYFFILGFIVQFMHNEISNNKPLLPGKEIPLKNYLIYGLVSFGIYIPYSGLQSLLNLAKNVSANGTVNTLIEAFLLVLYLFISIIWAFSQNSYADCFSFKDAIKFKRIFNLIFKVKLEIFIYLTIYLILDKLCTPLIFGYIDIVRKLHFSTTAFVISKSFTIPIVGIIAMLIFSNLQAQIYKIAKNRLENKEIAVQN